MNIPRTVTAAHMVQGLASGLYESVGQRVMELIRNSLAGSMPNPKVWSPKLAQIEITLAPSHPVSPKNPALVFLDHGFGLTEPALERYFYSLGTPLSVLREHGKTSFSGASQHGIGRFAALALNQNCLADDIMTAVKHGYYLFTRTSGSGEVRFVTVIPEKGEMEKGFNTNCFISPNAPEMGLLKGIQGSFTAIVIPTPIFNSPEEIYEAIKWLLPREANKMFNLTINGKPVQPAPLQEELNLTSADGQYRARLGTKKEAGRSGVWLCDSETGFPVASCERLGRLLLPDPLWYPELHGDIFGPRLLGNQNTPRSSLAREYTRKSNPPWRNLLMFSIRDLAPQAKLLIERDAITGDAAQTLDELAQMFEDQFGPAGPGGVDLGGVIKRPRKPGSGGTGGGGEPSGETKPPYRRYLSIKVRDEVFTLYRGQSLPGFTFAQVSPSSPTTIFVNVRGGYKALPTQKMARREHCLMQLLIAIGTSKYSEHHQAMVFANEIRAEFLK